MKQKSHEVSETSDSESVDNPSTVPSVKSAYLAISNSEKNSTDQDQESNSENESVTKDTTNVHSNSTKKSPKKSIQKKIKSLTAPVSTERRKSLETDTAKVPATFSIKNLSPDDEVYIFHCPENFKKDDLLNKVIDIEKSKQFVHTKTGEKYQLDIFSSENKQVTLAVPKKSTKGKLVNLPLKGHMIIHKVFETESNLPNEIEELEDFVIFPNNIKRRHPFLGIEWESYINSAREAIDKNYSIKKMKKKIKKEKSDETMEVENTNIKIGGFIDDALPKKKRKKHEC